MARRLVFVPGEVEREVRKNNSVARSSTLAHHLSGFECFADQQSRYLQEFETSKRKIFAYPDPLLLTLVRNCSINPLLLDPLPLGYIATGPIRHRPSASNSRL